MTQNIEEIDPMIVKRSKVRIVTEVDKMRVQGVNSQSWINTVTKQLKLTMMLQGRLQPGGAGIEFQHEINEVSMGAIYDDMSGNKTG